MPTYRVSLSFAQLPDSALSDFASTVIMKMTANPNFPVIGVPLEVLTTANDAFAAAIAAAAQGGKQLTAAKNAARATLEGLLRSEAAYVQSAAANDLTGILSSGLGVGKTDRTRLPLTKPAITNIDNFASTQLMVRLSRVDNARSYEFRTRSGAADWKNAGVFTKSRGVLLEDLTPGSTYDIQARAVGGSVGYSDWSDPVSHMAT